MVLRDAQGGIIFSACRTLYSCREALEAELCVCMKGLSIANQRSELSIAIEMDSLVAVKMVQGRDQDRSIYASLVKTKKRLDTSYLFVKIVLLI